MWKKWSVKVKGCIKACVRGAVVYGGETWVMRREEGVLQRAQRAMVRMTDVWG